jgi:hypothetical protein
MPQFTVERHPTTEGDDVPIGDLVAVRSFGDALHAFWIGRVVGIQGETLRVQWYERNGDKFFEMDEGDVEAFGEVEKAAIITRGKLLTAKNTLVKVAEKEINLQLAAEDNDRMITT